MFHCETKKTEHSLLHDFFFFFSWLDLSVCQKYITSKQKLRLNIWGEWVTYRDLRECNNEYFSKEITWHLIEYCKRLPNEHFQQIHFFFKVHTPPWRENFIVTHHETLHVNIHFFAQHSSYQKRTPRQNF